MNVLNELIIDIGTVPPAVLWGANNKNVEIIKKAFPKLKIVARGVQLKAFGEENELVKLDKSLRLLLSHSQKYNNLGTEDFERILNDSLNPTVSMHSTSKEMRSDVIEVGGEPILFGSNGLVIRAKTLNQRKIVQAINKNDILFAIGPAGTGKTYTAVALAVRALKNKEIKRIILTRPAVEAGENLGFLPGDLKEKVDPYLRPLYDALDDMIPPEKLKHYIENRIIEIAPLAFMRGRTLDNCFVILDEAQNATEMQLKMFLTRMGPTAKFIVTGDITQIDLPKKQDSGLKRAIDILKNIEGISFIYLDGSDVVRHKLVRQIIHAYDNN